MDDRNRYPGIDESTVKLIRFKAKQLCKQPGFCDVDQPDIEQELMIELLLHLHDYDPYKASLRTFAIVIVQQKIVNLIKTQFAQKRDPRAVSGSLNEFVQVEDDGHPVERWTTMDIDEYLQSTCATNRSREERLDLKIDLEMATSKLPDDLQRLCEFFSEKNITEVSRELNIARSTLYTTVNKIKKLLENAGLKIYL